MKRYRGIRYGFRPLSYWYEAGVAQAVLRNVKGRARRELLRQALADGRLEEIPELMQLETIPEGLIRNLGRRHPWLMGGEYLPDYSPDETEIVRVCLRSTTWDVISVRARYEQGRLWYRVVDEYGSRFSCDPDSSERPFNLGELVDFIDAIRCPGLYGPFSLAYNEYNAEEGLTHEELEGFTSISSNLYPQLNDHFQRVYAEWAAE